MKLLNAKTKFLLFLGVILLQACASSEQQNSGVQTLNPITSEAVISYNIGAYDTDLSASEKRRIHNFLAPLKLGPRDHLVVTIPRAENPIQNNARRINILKILTNQQAKINVQTPEELTKHPPVQSLLSANPLLTSEKYSAPSGAQPLQQGILRAVRTISIRVSCKKTDTFCSNEKNLSKMLANQGDVFKPDQTLMRQIKSRAQFQNLVEN